MHSFKPFSRPVERCPGLARIRERGTTRQRRPTAKRTGKSRRSIQRVVQRAAQNGRANLERVAGTALDRGAELDALPLLPDAAQELLIEQAIAGAEVSAVQAQREMSERSSEMKSLDDAAAIQQSSSGSTGSENDLPGLSELKEAWLCASGSAREAFLAWIETTTGQT
jgi:hypothetical protein